MTNAFDHIAADYDKDFTLSETGKLARQHVMDYVEKNIIKGGHLMILELNCGTGEDAIHLNKAGNEVFATDISSEMIRVAKAKAEIVEEKGLTFMQLSFAELPQEWMKEKFNLVFSNFGGLNCIDENELRRLFKAVKETLKPRGRFVGVVMPGYCLWEIFYFLMKGQWKKAFRRNKKGPVSIDLQGVPVDTWFYSPKKVKQMAGDLKIVAIRPVGLILPPSFLEGFFHKRKNLLKTLGQAEKVFGNFRVFAGISDHFLFDMKKK